MKRNPNALAQTEFDVLVIGGGIYGATIAWEAVLQGLRVALIEKNDFASATSANSLKTIHGGLRYLQHLDLARTRESIVERRVLSAIAPHQIHPLSCIMPTYGHMIKGPEVMRIGLLLNDLIGFDRNRLNDPEKHLPAGKILSKKRVADLFPYFDIPNLNGGALWTDAQMFNSERLLLSFIHSGAERGAVVCNYIEATDLLVDNNRVVGVEAVDHLSGERLSIRARVTLSATGPWINHLVQRATSNGSIPRVALSTALNLVVNRRLTEHYAFGVPSKKVFRDADAVFNKGSRLLFLSPWRGYTLVGTDHRPFAGEAQDYRVTEEDILAFLEEVNAAMPKAKIAREEVTFFYGGLLPMAGTNAKTGDVQLEKHFRLLDYGREHGLEGLIGVLSVKYTTARGVAGSAMRQVMPKLGRRMSRSASRTTRLWGGEIDRFNDYMETQINQQSARFLPDITRHLVNTYGSCYTKVLQMANGDTCALECLAASTPVLQAEVIFAVREEMAVHLADLILRRTELGSAGYPGDSVVEACAQIMAAELGWSVEQKRKEIAAVKAVYRPA